MQRRRGIKPVARIDSVPLAIFFRGYCFLVASFGTDVARSAVAGLGLAADATSPEETRVKEEPGRISRETLPRLKQRSWPHRGLV